MEIWSTQLDSTNNYWAIECRDEKTNQVDFHVLDLKEFSWKLTEFKYGDEAWWCGLLGIQKDVLVLQEFENSENPDEKTIHGVEVSSGKQLWTLSDWNLLQISGDWMHGQQKSGSKLEARSIYTGEPTQARQLGEVGDAVFPVFYNVESEHFEHFQSFITTELQVKPELGCDYLENQGFIIFSYYQRSSKGYDCQLVVVNDSGETELLEILETDLKGMMGSTFFIIGNRLFFIKNKNEICVYDLT